ncbi:MAG: hypothetical protein J6Q54_04555, partial [Oscillospiraceae bacterium]|nr:hypothetical protein [Oscillospiraceae bacterium]
LPRHQGVELGVDMGYRTPLFDITVTAQKQSPYTKLSQNELALQFFGAGFFDPMRANQALACLDMMDFDRKEILMAAIRENAVLPTAAYPATAPAMPKEAGQTPAMAEARRRTADAAAPR